MGRLSEDDVPHYLGEDLLNHSLEKAPPHYDMEDFPDIDFMTDSYFSKEEQDFMMEFYKQRRVELNFQHMRMIDEYEATLKHAPRMLNRSPLTIPIHVGIEAMSLLHCYDTNEQLDLIKAEGFKESDQGRDAVDGTLLEGAPPLHNLPRFPKAAIDVMYNGALVLCRLFGPILMTMAATLNTS